MTHFMDIGFFALLFFSLVFFHELGHFLMAKWMGVRVEKFSLGMGPKLFSYKHGDTEYRLALLPLGGYVKMSGDDPSKEYSEDERRVGFLTQKPGPKLLIVFGGPVFNLILPIFIYAIMMGIGIPTVDTFLGSVEPEMPAAQAGLRDGDRITSINGESYKKWSDLEEIVSESAEEPLNLAIERTSFLKTSKDTLNLTVTPKRVEAMSRFGEPVVVGRLGISPVFTRAQIYYENQESPIAKAGLKPFDHVVELNGQKLLSLAQLERALKTWDKPHLPIKVKRSEDEIFETSVLIPEGAGSVSDRIGLLPLELVLGQVSETIHLSEEGEKTEVPSPAFQLGLREGDRLVALGDKKLEVWADVPEQVKASEGKPMRIVWSRGGEITESEIQPIQTTLEDPLLGRDNPLAVNAQFRIGVSPQFLSETSLFIDQSFNPFVLLIRGFSETWNLCRLTGEVLGKLFTGQLSLRLLGSPIMIYKVAGQSFRMAGGGHRGWISFLSQLALLSVMLGLINLLPIPVLDGGHAMFFTLEAIRGKPVSLRTMEIALHIGLFLLIGLFALVLYNDFTRYELIGKLLNLFQ